MGHSLATFVDLHRKGLEGPGPGPVDVWGTRGSNEGISSRDTSKGPLGVSPRAFVGGGEAAVI
jgi:hypothetical protein